MAVVWVGKDGRRTKETFSRPMVDVTSWSNGWGQELSPFLLGPVPLYDGREACLMENAWQYSKVYGRHDAGGKPGKAYWEWAEAGWASNRPVRYPMGRGAVPAYSWWDGRKLDYVQARKIIYAPSYAKLAQETEAFKKLQKLYEEGGVWLSDFDVYDYQPMGMSLKDVIECTSRKCGHGFILAMMLKGERVWE